MLGFQLLAAKIHRGDHVHVFVSAPPKVCIPEMTRVLKCNSAKLLFEEFPVLLEKALKAIKRQMNVVVAYSQYSSRSLSVRASDSGVWVVIPFPKN